MIDPSRLLFVHAAPAEAGAHAEHDRVLELGVGKVAAAVGLTSYLAEHRPAGVVLFGVAGAHEGGPAVGEGCLVERDWLADEGVWAPDGFLGIDALGLGRRGPWRADRALGDWVQGRLAAPVAEVLGATVSLCSGTDDAAQRARVQCPDARVETMEGAAVGLVCERAKVPWAQLRVISNRTGDRDRAGWDLPGALGVLHAMMARLLPP